MKLPARRPVVLVPPSDETGYGTGAVIKILRRPVVYVPPVRGRRAKSRSGRAKTAVVAAAAVFVFAQLALNVALDTVRPEWRDPEYGWRQKAVRQLAGERPLVLAFGSSRTQMGFAPHALGLDDAVVYNFGQSGSGPLYLLLNLRRVLDAGVRPAAVLVEVMPATLAGRGPAERQLHDHVAKLGLADLDRVGPYCDDARPLRNQWLAHRALPFHAQRFLLLSHWQPGLLPWQARVDFQWRMMDDRGWTPYPFPVSAEERERKTAGMRREFEPTLRTFAVAPVPDRAIRDILALCRDRGIPAALYQMPEATTFRGWYPPAATAAVDGYLAGLSAEFGVPSFDATTWLPDDAFADGHHALRDGATRFSERFGRDCLKPWLASRKLISE